MSLDDMTKQIERTFLQAKIGRQMREFAGSPPDDLSEEMKAVLAKLENASAKKR